MFSSGCNDSKEIIKTFFKGYDGNNILSFLEF